MGDLNKIETLSPFRRFCMTLGALPTSYLHSLSYLEMVEWLCEYLEKTVIPTINNNAESVRELQDLFIKLRSFVENYFNDLDVQEEINNKLDEMASDGSLLNLLIPFFNSVNLQIKNISDKVDSIASGNPIPVDSIEKMVDTTKAYLLTTDNYWYFYDGSTWVRGGLYQSMVLAPNSVKNSNIANNTITAEKTDFAHLLVTRNSNILDKNNLIQGKTIKSWSTSSLTIDNYLIDNANGFATPIIEVAPNTIYKTVNKLNYVYKECHYAQFNEQGNCIAYTEATNTFEMLPETKYCAFSFSTSNAIPDGIVLVNNIDTVPIYSEFGYTNLNTPKQNFDEFINFINIDLEAQTEITENSYIATNNLIQSNADYNIIYLNLKKGETLEIGTIGESNVSLLSIIDINKNPFKNLISGKGIGVSNFDTYYYTANSNINIAYTFNKTVKSYAKIYYNNHYFNVINNNITQLDNNYFKALFNRVACLGDSITEGYKGSGHGMAKSPYPQTLGKLCGNIVDNYGRSGFTTIKYWEEQAQLINYADYASVILFLGTNAGLTDTLETDTTITDNQSYLNYANTNTGCYCKIIENIKNQNPNCKIFMCNVGFANSNTEDTIITNNVLNQIAQKYNLPLLNIYNNNFYPLDAHNLILHPWYKDNGDILHFSEIGYTILANVILLSINSFIANNQFDFIN